MSQKIKDNKNRWRNKTVAFRVSPEEWEQIERIVRLTGMSKQEYIMSRLENREIVVTPNPRVVKALRNEIVNLTENLTMISGWDEIENELAEQIKLIVKFLNAIIEENE